MTTITDFFGRVLQGRYRLEAGLGTGGFAHVFLAHDLNLDRRVAVKLLHSGLASDEQFFNRFRGEARAAAMLNHPNIVQVYDWGVDRGEPFLVLEYLAGGSLRDLLDANGSLGPSEVALIGAQTARGLAFAHSHGLIHRDIKPANLLFDEHGVVHIADFGLARALVDAAWTEPMGLVFGTARYASPEQAKGENVDQRSDVYSLALVCYEALVGESPFTGDTPLSVLMARVHGPLPYSPALEPFTPILMEATQPEINDRLDATSFAIEFELLSNELRPPRLPIGPYQPQAFRPPSDDTLTTVRAPHTEVINVVTAAALESPGGNVAPAKQGKKKLRSRLQNRTLRWGVIAVLVMILLGAGAASFVRFEVYGHVMPKFVGLTVANADVSARRADVKIDSVQRSFSSTSPTGDILTQTVAPGAHVRGGTEIGIVVSKGHAPSVVPTLVGKTKSAAFASLRSQHFKVAISDVYNETIAPGLVVSSSPSKGQAPFGSTISLQISEGPQPVTIPNIGGDTYAQAKQALVALHLGAKQIRQYSSDVTRGDVISTSPAIDTANVPVGTVIDVTVSRGPQYVLVPNVTGMSISDAIAALQSAGLVVTEQIGPPFATQAIATNPTAGTQVDIGAGVTLYAS